MIYHDLLHDIITIQVQRIPVCQYLAYGTAVTTEQCQYLHPHSCYINDKFKLILRHSNTKFHMIIPTRVLQRIGDKGLA